MPDVKTTGNLDKLNGTITITLGECDCEGKKKSKKVDTKGAVDAAKKAKRSFYQRLLETAPAQTVSNLGLAGSVALGTAAVSQAVVLKEEAVVLTANVAIDYMAGAFEVPPFFEQYIDPIQAAAWGQSVIEAKVAEAQEFIETASESRVNEAGDQGNNESSESVEDEQGSTEDESSTEETKEDGVEGSESSDDATDEPDSETVPDEDEGTDEAVDEGEATEENNEVSHTENKENTEGDVKPNELPKVVTPNDSVPVSPIGPA